LRVRRATSCGLITKIEKLYESGLNQAARLKLVPRSNKHLQLRTRRRLARTRVEMSMLFRSIDFTLVEKKRLIDTIRHTVERLHSLERDTSRLERRADAAQAILPRKRARNCASRRLQLKEIEESSDVGLTGLKRTLTLILRGTAGADKQRKKLTEANLRLVVSIAKKYNQPRPSVFRFDPGSNIGLMKAVDKFEWRRGYKFSTYGTWWIRQAVTPRHCRPGAHDPCPSTYDRGDHKMARTTRQLVQELGHEPTSDEIAKVWISLSTRRAA